MIDQIKELVPNALTKEEKGYITIDVYSMSRLLKKKNTVLNAGMFEFIIDGAVSFLKVNNEEMWRVLNGEKE